MNQYSIRMLISASCCLRTSQIPKQINIKNVLEEGLKAKFFNNFIFLKGVSHQTKDEVQENPLFSMQTRGVTLTGQLAGCLVTTVSETRSVQALPKARFLASDSVVLSNKTALLESGSLCQIPSASDILLERFAIPDSSHASKVWWITFPSWCHNCNIPCGCLYFMTFMGCRTHSGSGISLLVPLLSLPLPSNLISQTSVCL